MNRSTPSALDASDTLPPASDEVPLPLFQQAVEQSALPITITDPQARILYANPAFQSTTGFAVEEILGQNESILSYKVTPRVVYTHLWNQLMDQRPWSGMLVNKRKDGSRYLADLTITPVVDADGKTTHFLGMHRDITAEHQLERQVQYQKALIESVVDAAPVAIALYDDQERIVLDNQEYKKLISALGPEPGALLLGALRTQMGQEFPPAHDPGQGFSGQEVCIERSGQNSLWFNCAGLWFEEQDASADAFFEPRLRHYLLLVAQDITPLKLQEQEIRTTGLRALLAEKAHIQGLRETLSGALFQLEGPFNVLAAALHLVERKMPPGDGAALLGALESALRTGREAIETLRECIPATPDEPDQEVQLSRLLSDTLRTLTPELLAAGIVVDWTPTPGLAPVKGRPYQLANLFCQLLANAIDAIGETRGNTREIRLQGTQRGDWIEILVADSGHGIPEEWRLKVFQPFFTTKGADQQHIGMGLTMAQEIAASHGGLIDIDCTRDCGCCFRVQLPVAKGYL